jgi:hypothetical protein
MDECCCSASTDSMKECPIYGTKVEDEETIFLVCGLDLVNQENYDAYADEMDEEDN